jgi:phenylpropionate dioxygenase-like ring-hydroxylating dioxygenase large terminal subunit
MPRFPFPTTFTGWYQVAYSDEVPSGAVQPLHVFGHDLVVFRGEDGAVRVLDAYCPHLGAHVGYGGKVVGDGVSCPFHGWCFDGGGACVKVPYADKIPPRARLRAWPVREVAGLVLAWYDAEGAAPSWEPQAIPEHGAPGWAGFVRRRWTIRSHVLEIGENIVDGAHFLAVHGVVTLPETNVETSGPTLRSTVQTTMRTPRGVVPATIDSTAAGLGLWRIRVSGIWDTLFIAAFTPIDDNEVDARFSFLSSTSDGGGPEHGVGAAVIADVSRQVEQDIPIWEHKIYRTQPMLCAG